ncbi:hypothetical protein HY448_02305 [Candidatus Pacearchaeota archaeon]|nr:hypothetical protein [Candidatus Pacearchaeota archaeon]
MEAIKEFKSRNIYRCMFGSCGECSRIVDGNGFHDVEVYEIYEHENTTLCEGCDGKGYEEIDCPTCDGWGQINQTCGDCKGQRVEPDLFSEKKFIKEEILLIK